MVPAPSRIPPVVRFVVSVEAHLDGATADLVLVHHAHGPLGVTLVDEPHEAGPPLLHLGVLDFAAVTESENAATIFIKGSKNQITTLIIHTLLD